MGGECMNPNNREKEINEKKKENTALPIIGNLNNYQQANYQYNNNDYFHNNKIYNSILPEVRFHNYKKVKSNTRNVSPSSTLLNNQGKKKRIHNFTIEELKDQVNDILKIQIPFFENSILKTLSTLSFLSGNGPYHEGLLFFTTNRDFYIAQSYPITFIKVYDYYAGISEIISFNNLNKNAKKYNIPEIYIPQEPITMYDVLRIINNLPNKYNLLNDNCQNFCKNVMDILYDNFKIELDDKPNMTKINFLKQQKKMIMPQRNYSRQNIFSIGAYN